MGKCIMRKKMKKEIVKKFGDKLIKKAEQVGNANISIGVLMHEVEKPECLKRLDPEIMKEENKEVK